jgi:hypothetical protein
MAGDLLGQEEPEVIPAQRGETDDGQFGREKLIVDIWKQAVDTQKHFNDMCVKSRQLGLTFVAAALGAALYLFIRAAPTESGGLIGRSLYAYSVSFCGREIVLHVSLAIVIAAAATVYAVRLLDIDIYHRMLRGAVTFGEDLEEKHIRKLVELKKGMTQTISHYSRHSDAEAKATPDGSYNYFGQDHENAERKLRRFYNFIFIFLTGLAALIFIASNFLKAMG